MNRNWIISYIRQHRYGIFCFFIFCILCGIIFYVYHLEVEAVLYAGILCACIGICFLGKDYTVYLRRHRQLTRMAEKFLVGLEDLPSPENIIEEDYQRLLLQGLEVQRSQTLKQDAQRAEMMEYYTLWVHQIKTPIAAMRLILQESEAQERSELTAELFKIEQYVEMVLSYLRLESPSSDLVIRRQPLLPIVKQAVRKYAPLFIRKKLALALDVDEDCMVLTDEKWLAFVIEQILSNALKYTSSGSIHIYMEQPLTLVIEDTGMGIAAEDLPRLFEKGFTGYNGREDKRATGLGLYLSRRILQRLGHMISLDSQEGKGTQVKIDLDMAQIRTRE